MTYFYFLFDIFIIQGYIRLFSDKYVMYFEYISFSVPTPYSKDVLRGSYSGKLLLITNRFLGQIGLKCLGYALTMIYVH